MEGGSEVSPPQVEVVCLGVRGEDLDHIRRIVAERGDALGDDRSCQLVLDGEHVVERAIIRLGPQMKSVADADELSGDAQPVSGLTNAAFQDGRHVQGTADLCDVLALVLELKRGSPGRYLESPVPSRGS